ncbi:MAG: Gfo/Idh/MocA family oxidoreductase [Treponema sp.]|jgi:predicted dehydrogenase|nr:Gfo/Idh/MocA family oxidoreductase [Treponema sp.]
MAKTKIAFLGCGWMGQYAHLANYMQLDSCEVVGLCDAKKKQAELVAARYGVPRVYATEAELLSDPQVQGVVASQAFAFHTETVPKVLEAGKHLLTEKPLCTYPQNGAKLVEIAAKTGKIHMVANQKRSDPASEYAVDQIRAWKQSGEVGKFQYLRATVPPGDWVAGADLFKGIMTDEKVKESVSEARPAGVSDEFHKFITGFVNGEIHQVNLMHFLFGEDFHFTYTDKTGLLLLVESASGIPGILEKWPYSTNQEWHESYLACFEKGFIKVELPAPLTAQRAGKVTVYRNTPAGEYYTTPVLPYIGAMRNQAANFIKAINGEKRAPCTSADAVKDLQIAWDYTKAMGY